MLNGSIFWSLSCPSPVHLRNRVEHGRSRIVHVLQLKTHTLAVLQTLVTKLLHMTILQNTQNLPFSTEPKPIHKTAEVSSFMKRPAKFLYMALLLTPRIYHFLDDLKTICRTSYVGSFVNFTVKLPRLQLKSAVKNCTDMTFTWTLSDLTYMAWFLKCVIPLVQ